MKHMLDIYNSNKDATQGMTRLQEVTDGQVVREGVSVT